MRAVPTYAPVDLDDGTIPLKSREHFKFYEPLILLRALNDEMRSTSNHTYCADFCDVKTPQQLYEGFVNKLALVCDSTKGGTTVTSVWISEEKLGQIDYHLASNQRDSVERMQLSVFVTTLLGRVRDIVSPVRASSTTWSLLLPILRFNRSRINVYLDALRSEAQRCLDQVLDLNDENVETFSSDLRVLVGTFKSEEESRLRSELEYLLDYYAITQRLNALSRSVTGQYIEQRGREAREFSHSNCWSELRHMISRLLAYRQAVSFFLLAKAEWPRLFDRFKVTALPSSTPGTKFALRGKSLTADSIVGRLTRKEAQIKIFKDFVEHLQLLSLDDRILSEFTRDGFHPIVHSEVLLLSHIEASGGVSQDRFFNSWKYIASSKPTCKLCHYYFLDHGTGVGHRSSHGNLYTNWRFPDVLQVQGEAALERRTFMLTKLLKRVRDDTFSLVRRKVKPTYRNHDSVTSSARVTIEETWSMSGSQADDLASMLGQLDIRESKPEHDVEIGSARL